MIKDSIKALKGVNLLVFASVIVMGLATIATIAVLVDRLRTEPPTFTYDEAGGNGTIATVCAGSESIEVRVVGHSKGFEGLAGVDKSSSFVMARAQHAETGKQYQVPLRIGLSDPSDGGDFDFIFTAVFGQPLIEGSYTYSHFFFSVTTTSGATLLRGFESGFEVVACDG